MGAASSAPLHGRTFAPADAKGGNAFVAEKTALVLIEYQNEFTTEGGKLHDAVKGVMKETGMLDKTVQLCAAARAKGVKILHTPISFKADMSDNPNKNQGITKGCNDGGLFVENTWNSAICDPMAPKEGDLIVTGKRGLDAFPGTDLEKLLLDNGIETVAVAGFLTNCCVESTVRTAHEKGFNVVSVTDCTAAMSMEGQKAATEGTLGLFSSPMESKAFLSALVSGGGAAKDKAECCGPPKRAAPFAERTFASADAKGGSDYIATKTALVLIEYQNEFTTEGGKLHDGVKGVMKDTGMLDKSVQLCAAARAKGVKIMHAPISFKADMSDNPNKRQGITKGCADGALFVENTWNSAICDQMTPKPGDIQVTGKKGLDAFPGTDLEKLLKENGIETVAVAGFLTNCCCESTVRNAHEKGFNVVSVIDCMAATSAEGQKAATEGTLGLFSSPMESSAFLAALK